MTPYKTIHFCMIGALNSNVIYILHFLSYNLWPHYKLIKTSMFIISKLIDST